jgi:transposase-like protein
MNNHSKAKLTALSRAEMIKRIVDLQQPVAAVAAGFGISERCAYKWLARFRAEGSPACRTVLRVPDVPPEPPRRRRGQVGAG